MTFTFKLSRRLAQFRAITWLSTILLGIATISCSTDDSPGSASWDPTSPSRTTPLDPSIGGTVPTSNDQVTISEARGGKGKGRGRVRTAKVTVSPASVTLAPSAVQGFTATETLPDGSTTQPTVRWIATGGTVDSTGRYTAAATPGQYLVVATASDGLADTATATVAPDSLVVARVVLSPATASVATGATQQFTAVGKASDGSTVSIAPTYTATGGSITAAGLYTAGQTAGSNRVIARDPGSGKADTAAVTITAPSPTLQAVVLTPASVSLAPGATQQFTATGKMSDGSTSSVSITWSASGGTISAAGLYTAGQTAGSYRVIAKDQGSGKADTAAVTIASYSPTLQAIVLTPASVSLAPGATQLFAATGKMSDGSTSPVAVTWSASGGTISSSGLYTAGTTGGAFRVVATQQGGTMADTSSVTITTPAPSSPSSSSSCARTVNVSTASALSSAINNALPGDCIVMAPGTYSGGYSTSRSGTASSPITLSGPRTAIVGSGSGGDGLVLNGASYWVLKGFRVSNPTNGGIWIYGGNYNVVDSVEVDHTGTASIHIRVRSDRTIAACCVTGNVIRNSYIHDPRAGTYTEGIYLGSSYGNQGVYKTHIHHNTITNTGAEPIELKVGSDSTLIEFNTMTGGEGLVVRSSHNAVNDNTISSSLCGTTRLICVDSDVTGVLATNNSFRRNTGTGATSMFMPPQDAIGTKVYCDNVVIAPTVLGVTCTP